MANDLQYESYRRTCSELNAMYLETKNPVLQDALYLIVELYFEQSHVHRNDSLRYLTVDQIPNWLRLAESLAVIAGVKWTIIRREGGKPWLHLYNEQWTAFSNLVDAMILLAKLNEDDASYYYMVTTDRRATEILDTNRQGGAIA